MTQREFAITLAVIGAVSFGLWWWSWSMASSTYPRNDTAPLPALPANGVMPYDSIPYVPPSFGRSDL